MDVRACCQRLFDRQVTAHKGDFGRVGVIAGYAGQFGAAQLTSMAALRMGAGLVTCFSSQDALSLLKEHPELMVVPCLRDDVAVSWTALKAGIASSRCEVLAVGPGMGCSGFFRDLCALLLDDFDDFYGVFDADSLRVISVAMLRKCREYQIVLTPHVGEFKALFSDLGQSLDVSDESRRLMAMEAALLCGQIVVLKGHHSVVTDGTRYYINKTGNPSMATAGSGDVLTGMIAACMGQGLDAFEAACCGVYLHGIAGDLGHDQKGISLTASDILRLIPGKMTAD